MKKFYLLLAYLFFSSFVFSQKETNNWIFGFENWIDFNDDPPSLSPLNNPVFFAEHNTVSMSDENGELLFYSDGFSVFNKDGQVMPNGEINSNFGITNPVYAIPKPNSDHEYYLIINFSGFSGPFMEWRTIDMSMQNGLGDLVFGSGDFLFSNSIGKTTAVQHSNLTDIWVIGHGINSDNFFAFLATENGISDFAVESSVGSFIDSNGGGNISPGQIKTSPSGNKIAIAHQNLNVVEIFDFNKSTGVLSNPVVIDNLALPYGVEFSPNERYLYVTDQVTPQTVPELVQFDLQAGTQNDIINSKAVIPSSNNFSGTPGGLQLASDGKIYAINAFNLFLGSIDNPDEIVDNIIYNEFAVILNGESILGLPAFYHVYLQSPYFTYSGFCNGGITDFEINVFENVIDSVHWDFGDPTTGLNNFSTEVSPSHQFSSSGAFNITLTLYSGDNIFVRESPIHIAPTQINLNQDETVCSNIIVNGGIVIPNASYLWSSGETSALIEITQPGTYTLQVTVGDCPIITDEVTIDHIPAPDIDLGGDGGLCNGDEVILVGTTPNASYQWSTGSTTSSITIFSTGSYSVTVTSPNGCTDSDDVFYQVDNVLVNPSQANLPCYNDSSGVALVFLNGGVPPFSYEWDNGDTLYTRNSLSAGDYFLTVTDAFGCSVVQDFTITQPDEIIINSVINFDNPNTPAVDGQVLFQPTGGVPPFIYDWGNFGQTNNPLKTGLANGIYNVNIIDDNDCEKTVTVNVGDVSNTEDLIFLGKIQLFPNPVNELLYINFPQQNQTEFSLEVSNILGQKMMENIAFEKGKDQLEIDVSDWAEGVYFFTIKTKTEERIWKVNVLKD